MGIVLSKFGPVLVYPLGFSLLLVLVAGCLLWKSKKAAFGLLTFCFFLLWTCSTHYVADYLISTLGNDFSAKKIQDYPQAGAAVVLSGGTVKTRPNSLDARPDKI